MVPSRPAPVGDAGSSLHPVFPRVRQRGGTAPPEEYGRLTTGRATSSGETLSLLQLHALAALKDLRLPSPDEVLRIAEGQPNAIPGDLPLTADAVR